VWGQRQKIKMELTEQDNIPLFIEKWVNIGLATGPMDKAAVTEWLPLVYKAAGLPAPEKIYILDGGPLSLLDKYIELTGRKQAWEEVVCYGCQDAAWLAVYDFLLLNGDITGKSPQLVEGPEKFVPLMELAKAKVGWWLPFDKVAILSSPPIERHLKAGEDQSIWK